jgi:hypothetical protein
MSLSVATRDYFNVMPSVVMLNVIMLSVVRLNFVMLSVVAPPILTTFIFQLKTGSTGLLGITRSLDKLGWVFYKRLLNF